MRTPLGPKYMPDTYMDPLGVPPRTTALGDPKWLKISDPPPKDP